MAETDDWVAMASEYRAIAVLPGAESATHLGARAGARLQLGAGHGLMAALGSGLEAAEFDLARHAAARAERRAARGRRPAPRHWRVLNPRGAHALAVGIDAPIEVEIEGHAGYYCAGMNKQATVRVHGNAGVGVAENIMSGTVVVEGNASQSAGATGHGGLLVIRGDAVGALRHLDEGRGHRGAAARSGHMSAFMAQKGRLVVCGDAGDALGDSIYEARLYVRGSVAGLGADCVEKEMRDEHAAELGDAARARPRSTDVRRPSSAATARRASSTTSTSTTRAVLMTDHTCGRCASRRLFDRNDDRRDPARRARGDLRHPRLRRQAARAALRRPPLPRREHVALPARGLPRALRHRRDARRPPRGEAAPPRHPDHDRGDELRRAVGAGQGGARARRERGGHEHHHRRRRHDARGARGTRRRSSTSCCPRATG